MGIRKRKPAAKTARADDDEARDADSQVKGPSPNQMTNLVIADIALRSGDALVRRGLERGFLGAKYTPKKARRIMKSRGFFESLAGAALARAATTSVPGAILVGGGLLAKVLHDRRKGRQAAIEGEKQLAERAAEGVKKEDEA